MVKLEYYAKLFDKLLLGAIVKAPNLSEIALRREGILQVAAFFKKMKYNLETITFKDTILKYEFLIEREEILPLKSKKIEVEKIPEEESEEKEIQDENEHIEEEKKAILPIIRLVMEKIIIKIECSYNSIDSICYHYPKAEDIEIEIAKRENIDFIGNIKLFEIREAEMIEKRKLEKKLEEEKKRKEEEEKKRREEEKEIVTETIEDIENENDKVDETISVKISMKDEEETEEGTKVELDFEEENKEEKNSE